MNEIKEKIKEYVYPDGQGVRFNEHLRGLDYYDLREIMEELAMDSDPKKRHERNIKKHMTI